MISVSRIGMYVSSLYGEGYRGGTLSSSWSILLLLLLLNIVSPSLSSVNHPLPNYHVYHSFLLQDGFVRIPNVLTEKEALSYRDSVHTAIMKEVHDCQEKCSSSIKTIDLTDNFCNTCDTTTTVTSPSTTTDTPSVVPPKSFYRGRHILTYAPELSSLFYSSSLARIAAQVMNVSRVRYYQGTIFIKYPNDQPSAWHQDAAAIPLSTDKIVTLWIALDNLPNTSGTLRFIPGSHLPKVPLPSLRNIPLVQRLTSMKKWTDEDIRRALPNYTITEPVPFMGAGDATIHLGWTIHGSTGNTSPISRPAIAITYFADGARIHPELLRAEEVTVTTAGASASKDEQEEGGGGIRLSTIDGTSIIVRLLADDKGTWLKWLQARPPLLIPGKPVQDNTLTPILYDSSSTTSIDDEERILTPKKKNKKKLTKIPS